MIKVHLEVQPSMAESLGMEAKKDMMFPDGNKSVRDVLNLLSAEYQHFGKFVFDSEAQKLTGKAIVFINGRSPEPAKGLETRLKDGDVLNFVPLIEGG
ncbi:MAG: MoaD/ThiS family protein [Chloroflexota bacterium]